MDDTNDTNLFHEIRFFFFEIRQFFALHSTEPEIFINAGFFSHVGSVYSEQSILYMAVFSCVESDNFFRSFFSCGFR